MPQCLLLNFGHTAKAETRERGKMGKKAMRRFLRAAWPGPVRRKVISWCRIGIPLSAAFENRKIGVELDQAAFCAQADDSDRKEVHRIKGSNIKAQFGWTRHARA